EKVAQVRREIEAGMHGTTAGEQTLRQFAADWVAQHGHHLRSKTHRGYESMVAQHLDIIGDLPLTKLKPADIQAHYGRKLEKLSPTTVQHIHAFLHVVLENAAKLGIIPRNYADHVDAPPLKPAE